MFLNAFKNLFTSKTTNKLLKKGIHRRLELLGLEERVVPATITVTNTNDAGANSLRQAIIDANATPANDTIDFNFSSGSSPYTITLSSALPNIVDASTAGTLTITGLGATVLTISGDNGISGRNFRIFNIASGGNLSISGVTVSGAKTSDNGGAFSNAGSLTIISSVISNNISGQGAVFSGYSSQSVLVISDSIITGNQADFGAGLYNQGSMTVTNSTISNNQAPGGGNYGGGIFSRTGFTLSNSTVSNNTSGRGAGIDVAGLGIVNIDNSTIFGNSATSTSSNVGGGGINFGGGVTFNITNSTISGNSAAKVGGGINNDGGTLNIANTIIANSTSGGDYAGSGTVNVTSPSTAANNLVSQGSFAWATTKTSAEINLGTLANNGGPTQTLALLSGSVAIGAANATISNATPVNGLDQRGYTRSSTTPSTGAYEFNGISPFAAPTVTSISPTSGSTAGGTTITITGTDFTGATAVTIGGTAATNVTVVNSTTITATTPAGTAGTASVLVTTPGGTNAANTLFTYNAPIFPGAGTTPAVPFSPAFPNVLSINAPGSAVTNSAAFTVTFNQSVTGVDAADFNLVATGTVANGTISSVTGSGATYTVNVTGITGSGTLGLNLVDLPTITALPSFAAQPPSPRGELIQSP